jgi:hypothetical protein
MFAGEVELFTLNELWALFQACREAATSIGRIIPGIIRKRAMELLSGEIKQAEVLSEARVILQNFLK